MKWHTLLLSLLVLASCNNKSNVREARLKAEHQVKLEFLQKLPEPFEKKVPDSMKRWLPVFKRVIIDDQRYRIIGLGWKDTELKLQQVLDSQNLVFITKYIDVYGWPYQFKAGLNGQRAVGMVIQHAPLAVQEKYYPRLVEAFKKDSLLGETLAMLEDRINMRNNRFQVYGTQVIAYKNKSALSPVYNIDSIDHYRKQVGLVPIDYYMKYLIKITDWDINRYKKLAPEMIREKKITASGMISYSLAQQAILPAGK